MAEQETKDGTSWKQQLEEDQVKMLKDSLTDEDVKRDFFLEETVTLFSPLSKKLYKRVFEHFQTQATAAIMLTRKYGLQQLSNENVTKIDTALKQLATEMRDDIAYANKILEDIDDESGITKDAGVTVVAIITCPQGKALLDLIRQLDTLAVKLKTLWMKGELQLAQSEDRAYSWQRRIYKAAEAVRHLGARAYIDVENQKKAAAQKTKRTPSKGKKAEQAAEA